MNVIKLLKLIVSGVLIMFSVLSANAQNLDFSQKKNSIFTGVGKFLKNWGESVHAPEDKVWFNANGDMVIAPPDPNNPNVPDLSKTKDFKTYKE